jgi:hypothetical protein
MRACLRPEKTHDARDRSGQSQRGSGDELSPRNKISVVSQFKWPQEQAIAVNKTQSFMPVPQAVWDFHIGGYQVLDKYLKSRKGRQLSLDEINHVAAVADSLGFTIDQMAKIQTAYKAAFPEQG